MSAPFLSEFTEKDLNILEAESADIANTVLRVCTRRLIFDLRAARAERDEAEARGYRKGIEEAAKMLEHENEGCIGPESCGCEFLVRGLLTGGK